MSNPYRDPAYLKAAEVLQARGYNTRPHPDDPHLIQACKSMRSRVIEVYDHDLNLVGRASRQIL